MTNVINSFSYNNDIYTFTLPYGVCSTEAGATEKVVTVDNFSLEEGAVVIVKFTNSNSVSSPTLNVNGTGAKPIYRYGTTVASTGTTTTGWTAGAIQLFIYDGVGWIRDYWSNTTYSNASLGQGYATCSTAASTKAKTASLSSYSLTTGGIVAIKFTNDVCADATLNIEGKGAKDLYFRGAAITGDIIKAGDIATFIYSTNYHLISIDRWQNDIINIKTDIGEDLALKADITYVDEQDTQTLNSAKAYTDQEVAGLVNSAPETLDTLNELAQALGDDPNFATTVANQIGLKADKSYVDNQDAANKTYTDTEINKVSALIGDKSVADQITEAISTIPQSDWNQNDENAQDYIKNRTHWIDEEWVLISDEFRSMMIFIPIETDITNGLTELGHYRFTIDNTDVYLYEKTTEDKSSRFCIGGASGDNLPFKIERYDAGPEGYILRRLNKMVSSFKVEYLAQSIKQLDDKYISSSIARTAQLIGQASSRGGEIFNDYENNSANSYSHAEGYKTTASGNYSHTEGQNTIASGESSHAEGRSTEASGDNSHAEGSNTVASGDYSHVEGGGNDAVGDYSHAEGANNRSTGDASHTEGADNKATNSCSHAEGASTEASGEYSHAEGYETKALEVSAHAEGFGTTASGEGSHAEGGGSIASGYASHAEGQANEASEFCSHAEGQYTKASGGYQHVQGRYNVEDAESIYAHIVGNGDYDGRSNAHTLDWQGNGWFSGDVYVGSTSGINKDEGSKKLATEDFITTEINKIPQPDLNQTDETAPDYIKNKPTVEQIVQLFVEMDVVQPIADENNVMYVDINGQTFIL